MIGSIVLAAVLMGLAVAAVTRPRGLNRLRATGSAWTPPTWARGRRDSWPLRQRLGFGVAGVGLAGLAAGLPLIAVPPVAVVGGALVAIAVGRVESFTSRRRAADISAALPQACDLLAACLDAGQPLRGAARIVGENIGGALGEELSRVAAHTTLGVSDHQAWRSMTHPALERIGRDLAHASEHGTVSAAHLRMHAVDATARAQSAREELARRVGVKSVLPLMVCFLPAFMLLGIVPIVGGFVDALMP